MSDTEMPADGVMPTPDMTTVRPAAEPTLSEREEQKLAMYRQRHPVAGGGGCCGQEGETPNPPMNT